MKALIVLYYMNLCYMINNPLLQSFKRKIIYVYRLPKDTKENLTVKEMTQRYSQVSIFYLSFTQ